MKNKSNDTNIYTYIIFVCTFFLFLLQSLFQIIPILIFNLDIDNITNLEKAYLTTFSSMVTLIIIGIIYRKILINDFKKLIKSTKKEIFKNTLFSVKYWIISLIIMALSLYVFHLLGLNDSVNNSNVKELVKATPIIMGIQVLVIGALVEEIIFRLSFKTVFKSKISYILISGIVFGSLHVLSITSLMNLLYLIPYCSSGIILSYIYFKTDNIYYSYFIHVIHNLLMLIVTLLEVI